VPAWLTVTVSFDARHVRPARGQQRRTFKLMAIQVSNDVAEAVLSSSVPGEADRQRTG